MRSVVELLLVGAWLVLVVGFPLHGVANVRAATPQTLLTRTGALPLR